MSMSSLTTLDSLKYYLTSSSVSTRPAGWNVSLHTGAPGANGAASEVTDVSYSRQPVTFSVDATDAAAPVAANSAVIVYQAAQSGYTATHCVVWDTTNNKPLAIQRLSTDKVIAAGEQAQFSPGDLRIGGRN